MANNWSKGKYTPKNPEKYIGKHTPTYRSSWENSFMMFLDNNQNIRYWASESISIPYKHPLTGQIKSYVPDFFVIYENKYGAQKAEILEIKPKKQSVLENKGSIRDRAAAVVNMAKWEAAQAYCKQQGFTFRVLTEEELFFNGQVKQLKKSKQKPKPKRRK